MLWILIIICVSVLLSAFILDFEDLCLGSFVLLIILCGVTAAVFSCYHYDKTVVHKKIVVLEQRNSEVLEQIEPFVEQYLKYEKDSYKELKLNANTLVTLAAYPELKGNEFVMKQIDIVLENQKQITKLKLDIARLDAYKPWLFMGE